MKCSRCQGLMLEDCFLDLEGSLESMWATSWRCVNCGHVHDSVIERNRLGMNGKIVVLPSSEPDYHDDEARFDIEPVIEVAA